ncbi:MAG: 23S rRNA (pseudouridine(1915)-N(3))-methyltransferase RlmH [Hyphomicrobiales bacterium]
MQVTIIAVGRLRSRPMLELFEDYGDRFAHLGRGLGITGIEVRELAQAKQSRPADRRRAEAQAILTAGKASTLVALDERGRDLPSPALADYMQSTRDNGAGALSFIIGGPDGLDQSVTARVDRVIGFGRQTWPHQMVRVMLAEQLYRALTIISGHPYHRS